MNYKDEIRKLSQELNQHNYNYYALDNPTISDLKYDELYQKLLALEKKHNFFLKDSPTQRVGGFISKKFEKSPHSMAMLSIQNCFSDQEIHSFDSRVKKLLANELSQENLEYFCQPKLDGLAMELIYKNGKLEKAITRGDGLFGETVTENIKTIKCIPLTLSNKVKLLEVRGEIIMKKNDFQTLNQKQAQAGEAIFSNPRNAAAGSVRQLNTSITASRKLFFYAYACGLIEGISFKTHSEMEDGLKNLGLPTIALRNSLSKNSKAMSYLVKDIKDAIKYKNFILSIKPDLEFDVDGVVIKVNNLNWQQKLGATSKYPRWTTAAKFKAESSQTKVLDIKVQVGRTGALTPVAILKPVQIAGVTITHASLHNQDEINKKDIRINDTVNIQRAGDVIPYITCVDFSKRKKDAVKFKIPNKCPSCNLKVDRSETLIRCTNIKCSSILKENLKHFVSRNAMNIDLLGEKLIEKLFFRKLIKSFSDLYLLKEEHILSLDGYKEKSAKNILQSIENSKKCTLSRFIFALGIRHVGENTAKLLSKRFKTIDNFLNAKQDEFFNIEGIGEKTSLALTEYLGTYGKDEIQKLKRFLSISKETLGENSKNIVLTGKLSFPKKRIKEILERYGYNVLNSVSKNTHIVLFGEKAGSKLKKADELGIKKIDASNVDWENFKGLS